MIYILALMPQPQGRVYYNLLMLQGNTKNRIQELSMNHLKPILKGEVAFAVSPIREAKSKLEVAPKYWGVLNEEPGFAAGWLPEED